MQVTETLQGLGRETSSIDKRMIYTVDHMHNV